MECKQKENKLACSCTANCELSGLCCDCVSKHRSRGQIPGCFFTEKGESLHDRNIQTFFNDRKGND
ncbi:MAG: DUF6485 family protein [Eubacteriaceae bacterium]